MKPILHSLLASLTATLCLTVLIYGLTHTINLYISSAIAALAFLLSYNPDLDLRQWS